LQIRVLVFSKVSALIKSGIFSGGYFPSFYFLKINSGFCFKKVRVKFSQVSKICFKVFRQSFGRQAVSFCKVFFSGLRFTWQSQVSKIGYVFFRKTFGKFGSGFLAKFIFSGKVGFW